VLVSLRWRKWKLAYDADATRRMYELRVGKGKSTCSCPWCRNFYSNEQPGPILPAEAKGLFDTLGIELGREVELLCPPVDSRLKWYTGFLGFVGRIAGGPDASGWQKRSAPHAITDRFEIGFAQAHSFWQGDFEGQPTVEVIYSTEVPWVLSEPDPDIEWIAKQKGRHRQTTRKGP